MRYLLKQAALMALVPATFLLGTAFAIAMPAGPGHLEFSPSSFIQQISFNGINGRNVTEVTYPGGKITLNGKRWTERNANGSNKFVEVQRDAWSVYLLDRSRNVRLQLDLHRKLVLYAAGNDPMQPLYQITGATMRANRQASSDKVYRFTCTEGIPLVVRVRNRGGTSTAFASIDGGRELRLNQVRSGSGTRYSDGNLTVSMKGNNASFDWGSTHDNCRR